MISIRLKAISILPLILVCGTTFASEQFMFMRFGQLSCPKEHAQALEEVLDSKNQADLETRVKRAIFSGDCSTTNTAYEVVDIRPARTPSGRRYLCFAEVDEANKSKHGPYCATEQAITTISGEIARRSGDYKVAKEEGIGIKAECLEGGFIIVRKTPGNWERMPFLFPLRLEPPIRSIPAERNSALRDGCKGLDYAEGGSRQKPVRMGN